MICRGITFSYGDVRIVGNHCGGVSGYCWSNLGSIALFDIAKGVTDSYIVGRRGSLRTRVRACQVVPEIYHHSATWMRVSDLCTPETVAAVYFTGGLVWSFWARCHNRDVLISCGGTIRSLFSELYNRGSFFILLLSIIWHILSELTWRSLLRVLSFWRGSDTPSFPSSGETRSVPFLPCPSHLPLAVRGHTGHDWALTLISLKVSFHEV